MENRPLPDDLISTPKAARLLDVHISTIRQWFFKGRIRGWRVGGRWKVSRAEVLNVPKIVPAPVDTPASKAEIDADYQWARSVLDAR
jgi:excisionase family DNA binding protein